MVPIGRRFPRKQARSGYSLIELMIVVAILGILAATAAPAFMGYIQRSRTGEAVEFLGAIKLRQEAYRAEFGQYAQVGGYTTPLATGADGWAPGSATRMKDGIKAQFPDGVHVAGWSQLGARPAGAVRFGYHIAAGTPDDIASLPGVYGFNTQPDFYFIAQATSDLDGDGTPCLFEVISAARGVYYQPAQGWE